MKNSIIFVSYGEQNANENWYKLVSAFPIAIRVDGIKGIYNAYKRAADIAKTDFFYIVDADNIIMPNFKFDFIPDDIMIGTYIWQSKNSVNQLTYGFGGIKLYNKLAFSLISDLPNESNPHDFMNFYDFPIAPQIKFIKEVGSITQINSSIFDAWKAAFRECCKLISFGEYLNLSKNQLQDDLDKLNIWCSVGQDKPFGEWVIRGANDGRNFGAANTKNISELEKINDYSWLKKYFTNKYKYVFT